MGHEVDEGHEELGGNELDGGNELELGQLLLLSLRLLLKKLLSKLLLSSSELSELPGPSGSWGPPLLSLMLRALRRSVAKAGWVRASRGMSLSSREKVAVLES